MAESKTRDRTFEGNGKVTVNIDPRKDVRFWGEAVRKERAFQWRAPAPTDLAAERGGNELGNIQQLRHKLEKMSSDYVWAVETDAADAAIKAAHNARAAPTTSSMAELANGVPTVETSFLRPTVGGMPRRVARIEAHPNIVPWQHSIMDPCFLEEGALAKWQARKSDVLQLPPPPPPPPRIPAEVSGPHAAAIAAWRRSEVPLSQWELSERGDSLVEATKLSNSLAQGRAKEQLNKLLRVTEKASRGKPRWFER